MSKEKTGQNGQPEQNPALEMAAKEISDILQKYDIAGIVQLYTPGFNKYTMKINTSWSVVSVNGVGQLKINPPLVDPQNEAPAQARILDTIRMLANMRICLGKLTVTMTQAEMAVRQHFHILPPKDGPQNLPFKN